MNAKQKIRVAAIGDLHCTKNHAGKLQPIFAGAAEVADILLLCGDLTDYGLPEEARVLANELAVANIPIVGVLGNHDFESDQQDEVKQVLANAGVQILDGDACEIYGLGIAGAKGFAGGFGRNSLGPWGEPATKAFVNEALTEALKLEAALAKLRTYSRIALLHYSPILATVEGEPPEIFAFLGNSRLEDPLVHYPVDVVFHGHAHRGQPEGRTVNGTPVYNVAKPLLERTYPDQPPFRVLEFASIEPID